MNKFERLEALKQQAASYPVDPVAVLKMFASETDPRNIPEDNPIAAQVRHAIGVPENLEDALGNVDVDAVISSIGGKMHDVVRFHDITMTTDSASKGVVEKTATLIARWIAKRLIPHRAESTAAGVAEDSWLYSELIQYLKAEILKRPDQDRALS